MPVLVDTNLPIVANGNAPQATTSCVAACAARLQRVQREGGLVLDDGWRILREYMRNLCQAGEPGVGDAFLRWVLTNRTNPGRCILVHLRESNGTFLDFPRDPELQSFDLSDRKFVAAALTHHCRPPILNATDSDWWHSLAALRRNGVSVEFVCGTERFEGSEDRKVRSL